MTETQKPPPIVPDPKTQGVRNSGDTSDELIFILALAAGLPLVALGAGLAWRAFCWASGVCG